MLDICLLGTGGMMPMPSRFLTAMLARLNGRLALIDCGEGTQVTMKMLGWGFKPKKIWTMNFFILYMTSYRISMPTIFRGCRGCF